MIQNSNNTYVTWLLCYTSQKKSQALAFISMCVYTWLIYIYDVYIYIYDRMLYTILYLAILIKIN